MISIYVNEKCNGCGGCLESSYFEEKDIGYAQVKRGAVIPDSALDELQAIGNDCPCQAIIIESKKKSAEDIASELLGYINEIPNVSKIENVDDISMDKKKHWINFDYHIPYSNDGYSSYDRAYDSLRSEIHCIWDDRKDYAFTEAQKYVNEELRKYWDIEYSEGIYAQAQSRLKNAVHAISNCLVDFGAITSGLSEKDYNVNFTEWTLRQLLEPECLSKKWAEKVYDMMDYNNMLIALHKANIESYEDCVEGLFGKMKDKTRWKYSEGYAAEDEIREIILQKLIIVSEYDALYAINEIIDEYNKQLDEKKNKLKELINNNIK